MSLVGCLSRRAFATASSGGAKRANAKTTRRRRRRVTPKSRLPPLAPVASGPSTGEFHDPDLAPSSTADPFEKWDSQRPAMQHKPDLGAKNSPRSHAPSDNLASKRRPVSLSAKRTPQSSLSSSDPTSTPAFDRATFRPHPNMTQDEMKAYIADREKQFPLVGMHRFQDMISGPPEGTGKPGGGSYLVYIALGCGAIIAFHTFFGVNSLLETPQFPQLSTRKSWDHFTELERYERLDFMRHCISFSLMQPVLTEVVRYWACVWMLGVLPPWFVVTASGVASYNWFRIREGNIMRGNSQRESALRSILSMWFTHALIRYSMLAVPVGMHVAVNTTETVLFFHEKLATYEATEDLLLAESKSGAAYEQEDL